MVVDLGKVMNSFWTVVVEIALLSAALGIVACTGRPLDTGDVFSIWSFGGGVSVENGMILLDDVAQVVAFTETTGDSFVDGNETISPVVNACLWESRVSLSMEGFEADVDIDVSVCGETVTIAICWKSKRWARFGLSFGMPMLRMSPFGADAC